MATTHSKAAITRAESPLSSGDASHYDELAARRRARTSLADATANYRAELVTEFVRAWVAGDAKTARALMDEAGRFDTAHPDQTSLVEELLATQLEVAA